VEPKGEGLKRAMDMIHGRGAGIHMGISTPCIALAPLVTSEYICGCNLAKVHLFSNDALFNGSRHLNFGSYFSSLFGLVAKCFQKIERTWYTRENQVRLETVPDREFYSTVMEAFFSIT
jgi:hypothetical protein